MKSDLNISGLNNPFLLGEYKLDNSEEVATMEVAVHVLHTLLQATTLESCYQANCVWLSSSC